MTCAADIKIVARDLTRPQVLLLACDGIFDVMSNEEAGAFIMEQLTTHGEIFTAVRVVHVVVGCRNIDLVVMFLG